MKTYKQDEEDVVFPKAFEEITVQKNSIKIYFTNLDEEEFEHDVQIDKNKTLEELKDQMAQKIGASPDEFKILKGISKYKHELRDLDKRISLCHINNNEKLTLVKGTPLGKNDALFKFSAFRVTDETFEITDLFQCSFKKTLSVEEAKVQFLEEFKQWKANPEDPEKPLDEKFDLGDDPTRLRFSLMSAGYPSTVLPNDTTMEAASRNLLYSIPQLSVQVLPEGETEGKTRTNICVYVQQYFPSTGALGKKMNFYMEYTQEIEELREEIREKTGCQNISLSPCEKWDTFTVLDIGKFPWYKQPEEGKQQYSSLRNVRSLRPRDGYILMFKDGDEAEGALDDETKKALLERYKTSKPVITMVGASRTERQLKINQGDVDIDDFFNEDPLTIDEPEVNVPDE